MHLLRTDNLAHFDRAVRGSQHLPCLLTACDIGPCRTKWTPDYLSQLNPDPVLSVHVCRAGAMDFRTKNFEYRVMSMRQLLGKLQDPSVEEKFYLRSVGADSRSEVADFGAQFAQLADDLIVPPVFEKSAFFSSVLRLASPGLRLWTHYDVMDNILIQAVGSKTVSLFPPADVPYLYLDGDKSRVVDIDDYDRQRFPLFERATRTDVVLEAGQVLFIPALWFHSVVAHDFSVAVNVFWRSIDPSLYDKKDLYGNHDFLPAKRSFQSLDNAITTLKALPDYMQQFYLLMHQAKLQKRLNDLNLYSYSPAWRRLATCVLNVVVVLE